jgi:hypothetical protein
MRRFAALLALLLVFCFAASAVSAPAPTPKPARKKEPEKRAQGQQGMQVEALDVAQVRQLQRGQVVVFRLQAQQAQGKVRVLRLQQPPPAPPK